MSTTSSLKDFQIEIQVSNSIYILLESFPKLTFKQGMWFKAVVLWNTNNKCISVQTQVGIQNAVRKVM